MNNPPSYGPMWDRLNKLAAEASKYHSWDGVMHYTKPGEEEMVLVIQKEHPRWYRLMVRLGIEKLPIVPKEIGGVKCRVEVRGIARLC